MNIKIKLPNPTEMDINDWFTQMELSLYHAKKSYEKFIENMDEKQIEDVSIYLSFPELTPYTDDLDEEKPTRINELNWENFFNRSQEIDIVVSY